ncbi:MAG: nucleotidyltransferase domain-containing protein [Longimicrobiales bacterium]
MLVPGARVWAFGSRARGSATWDSDFDVCVVCQTPSPLRSRPSVSWPGKSASRMHESSRP